MGRWGSSLVLLCASVSTAGAPASAPEKEAGPWLMALGAAYVVTDVSSGDLDGDGRDETVVCYREGPTTTQAGSGVAVFAGRGPRERPLFHTQLEGAPCEKVRVNGRKLGVLLEGHKQLVWTLGEELKLRTDPRSPIHAKAVTASSHAGQNVPTRAFDGDVSTSWAEGADGTGIGQTITITLDAPVDIGAVGIFCGEGSGLRSFFDNNRVHRGSIEAKTEADLGDTAAGFDFASLGIDALGDRVEFSCENRPELTYVALHKRGVVELEVRIESVYLGDKKDDTHIAEIELVPRLGHNATTDRAVATTPRPATPRFSEPDGPPPIERDIESPTAALDAQGRGIPVQDDL